jgi:hypothetical protein
MQIFSQNYIMKSLNAPDPTSRNNLLPAAAADSFQRQEPLGLGRRPIMQEDLPDDLKNIKEQLTKAQSCKDIFNILDKAQEDISNFHKIVSPENTYSIGYHYGDYKILPGLFMHNRDEFQNLSKLKEMNLQCAPSVVDHYRVGADESILVTKGNGDIIPYNKGKKIVSPEDKLKFMDDLKRLLDQGLFHPYLARGTSALSVNKDIGHIVIDEWIPLRHLSNSEDPKEILENIKSLLDK